MLVRGSFSVVYRGTSPAWLDMAIKTVDPVAFRGATPGEMKALSTMLLNEAKLLSRLQHPNLVVLLAYGMEGEGRVALVLEHTEWTLRERLFDDGLVTQMGRLLPVER